MRQEGSRASAFNRLKYVLLSFFFFYRYYLRVRRDSAVRDLRLGVVPRLKRLRSIIYGMKCGKLRKRKTSEGVYTSGIPCNFTQT